MRASYLGRITYEPYVTCGMCEYGQYVAPCAGRTASQELKQTGWKRTQEYGYICPTCAENLTTSPNANKGA